MIWNLKLLRQYQVKILGSLGLMLSLIGVASPSYSSDLATAKNPKIVPYSEEDIFQIAQLNIQPQPIEDRFPQPTDIPQPLPSEKFPENPGSTDEDPENTPVNPPISQITVNNIEVRDSSIFNQDYFNSILQPLIGKTVSLEELQQVTDQITQLYLEQGYITSRAVIVEDSLLTGNIILRVIEGELEAIEIEGTKRLNPNYIRSRINLGADKPLNSSKLEDQLRLLRADPLLENVEASLKAGSSFGKSILTVKVTESRSFYGSAGFDNYSPPSIGSERFNLELGYQNLTGIGDKINLLYHHTLQGGDDKLELSYSIPVNAMDGTVQVRSILEWNQVIQPDLKVFDISGNNQLYEISYRQPLIKTPREEFALLVGFTYQDGQTFLDDTGFGFGFGPEADGDTRTSVFKFGQEYIKRDVSGAWAFRSLFNFGTGIFNATINDPPIPDGIFFSWLGQIQRVQVLNSSNLLIIQGDIQLTPNSLLPSQQFVIGGGQSVRGYRQNVRAGDNGFRISLEDRITVHRNAAGKAIIQLAPFLDFGKVWNVSNNPNQLPNETFIIGLGMGLLIEPISNLNIRLDYGYPFINLDDRGENAQDQAFYFSINYAF